MNIPGSRPRVAPTIYRLLKDTSRQLICLAQDGIRYILLHKATISSYRLTHWRRFFLIQPYFEDQHLVVYETTPIAGRNFTLIGEPVSGVGPVQVFLSTDCLSPGSVLEATVGWGTVAAPGQDVRVQMALTTGQRQEVQAGVYPLSQDWPVEEWPANAVGWEEYRLALASALSPGPYTFTLSLIDPAAPETATVLYAQHVTAGQAVCQFDLPPDVVRVNALYGDELRLLGYWMRRAGANLTVSLYWRAERRVQTDYTVFVHVVDPLNGLRVAQDDAMPLRWTYPTTLWTPGEMVIDDIPLSLDQAPSSTYSVMTGVYDLATGQRLPVLDGAGQPQPDNVVILPGAVVQVEE